MMVDERGVAMDWSIDDVFSDTGLLASKLEGYESRPSQIEFSKACEKALDGEYHLAAEGPTGTGKSIGYLVPAIKKAKQDEAKVVIATANIALQEQLFYKDLPFLAGVLPGSFEFVLVKGRNNYLCVDLLEEKRLKQQTVFDWHDEESELTGIEKKLIDWSGKTSTGDKSEIDFQLPDKVWKKYSVSAQECLGKDCLFKERCYANAARGAMNQADVIVVNYHLLFAHINLRIETGLDLVLPAFDYLICDEGHKVPDIARDWFGGEVSHWALNRMVVALRNVARKGQKFFTGDKIAEYRSLAHRADSAVEQAWGGIKHFYGEGKGATRIRQADTLKLTALANLISDMGECFGECAKEKSFPKQERSRLKKHGDRAKKNAALLREFSNLPDENATYFMEPFGKLRSLRLVKRKLVVSDLLWEHLFCCCKSVVVTSATLAVNGNCDFLRNEIGMSEGKQVLVDSPFDFKSQVLLLAARRGPEPNSKQYPEYVAVGIGKVIEQAQGRTLALFTSYRVMSIARDYLLEHYPEVRIMCQGDNQRKWLLDEFRSDVSSVLLGTESFWAGVDIPGESLSCLTIDRLPFPSPSDPVLEAMMEKAQGGGFWDISVPRAILQFRQGAGRLIRRKTDRGVIVVWDHRMTTKGYGDMFLRSLPRMQTVGTMKNGEIRNFLDAL
jgi:ATP-dependent DNA helicase DinG